MNPGIDDSWGRIEAASRAFLHKAETHPEHAPTYVGNALILAYLHDSDFRSKVIKVLQRRIGTSKGRHGLAYLQAERFAEGVKADLLANTLQEAAKSVQRQLEAAPLLWGRAGKLGQGHKRPRRLNLGTLEDALRDAYGQEECADIRAECALALAGDGDRDSWQVAHSRFLAAVDTTALAKKVLRAVRVEPGWEDDLFE